MSCFISENIVIRIYRLEITRYVVISFVLKLTYVYITKNVEDFGKKLQMKISKIVGHVKKWLQAKANESIVYTEVYDILKQDWDECTQSDRSVMHNDLINFFQRHGMGHNLVISIEHWDGIFKWFRGLCALVLGLNDLWNLENPKVLHGFFNSDKNRKQKIGEYDVVY